MRPGESLYSRGSNDRDGEGRRFFLVIALSLGVVWAYSTFFGPQPPPPKEEEPPTAEAVTANDAVTHEEPRAAADDDSAAGGSDAAATAATPAPVQRPEPDLQTTLFDGEGFQATFSNQGGGPQSFVLRDYYEELDLPWIPTWLWDGIKSGFDFDRFSMRCPEGIPVELIRGHQAAYYLIPWFDSSVPTLGGSRWEVLQGDDGQVVYRTWQEGNLEVLASYGVPKSGFLMDYEVTVRNVGTGSTTLEPSFSVFQPIEPAKNRYSSSTTPFLASIEGKVKDYAVNKLDKKGLIHIPATEKPVRFAGMEERYFMTALVPAEVPQAYEAGPMGYLAPDGLSLVQQPQIAANGQTQTKVYRSTLRFANRTLDPGEETTFTFDLYMGPKVLSDLKELDLGLEATVQYGMFSIIARPMLWLLKFMFGLVGSWGIAIILLTVVVKIIVYPLDQASYKSMKKMRVLAPRMQEIRDKFKSDPQRQQQEIMNMYKEAGANPFSGCIPMLVQMPIWFALYRVLWSSIELYQVPFLYFCDLTARDPICIFPLALSGIMYVQQKMSPPPTDPNQKMMMQMMPFFFAFIMFALPSGLVLYILVSSLLRLLQQWMVNRSSDDEPAAPEATTKSKKKSKNKR